MPPPLQPPTVTEKIRNYLDAFASRFTLSRLFAVLALFLLAVVLIAYLIPLLDFGRFFGTDDYTHLFHTEVMESSLGISDFYENMGGYVSNPASGENMYNYPFGVWLFGGTIAKVTGLSVLEGAFIFIIFFFLVIIASFYFYSDVFLHSREEKILAVLFLLCMPNAALALLSFRPSVFTLPFLFVILYITFREPFDWKLLPIIWVSIFAIIVSHTGSFIFLISFIVLFFLLLSLLWGKISDAVYLVIMSTLVIYVFAITWFPQIAYQYNNKATLFLSPGQFLAAHTGFGLPSELGNVFYQNVIVNHELIYTILLGATIYVLAIVFRHIHRKVREKFRRPELSYPVTLPVQNISHSVAATPLWLGPVHLLFAIIGYFKMDMRGKCMLVSAVLIGVLPDLLFENADSSTGVLREISFLVIILPIAASLGFFAVLSYIGTLNRSYKKVLTFFVWFIVLVAVILTPALVTTYYLPRISGEDYVIGGMQWLGTNGDSSKEVIGYGYRTVPIYTNMTDAAYGVESGSETRNLMNLLQGSFFEPVTGKDNVDDLHRYYGISYIMSSDKIISNLGNTSDNLTIDRNTGLDKIYASNDFGIYAVPASSETMVERKGLTKDISIEEIGSSIRVTTDVYKIVLEKDYPVIDQFGTPTDNFLGGGVMNDVVQISGFRKQPETNPYASPNQESDVSTVDYFSLNMMPITPVINGNEITYKTILKDQVTGENEATLLIRYTFYPETVKREFIVSNDWITATSVPYMNVEFSTSMFVPQTDFVLNGVYSTWNRHIYPSTDTVWVTDNIKDLFLYDSSGKGIYLRYEPTSSYPVSMAYKGSTLYSMSDVIIPQSTSLQPGTSYHITQYMSPGDQVTAREDIATRDDIRLLDYPNGTAPIILTGYQLGSSGYSPEFSPIGYQLLREENVPYTEILYSTFSTENTKPNETYTDPLQLVLIKENNAKVIGSTLTGESSATADSVSKAEETYYNYSTQLKTTTDLVKYAKDKGLHLIGYMPNSLDYNLDTLKIMAEKDLPFLVAFPISPPYYGTLGTRPSNMEMARYHDGDTDVVLLPLQYPMSTSLTENDTASVFPAWNATIDDAVLTGGMTMLVIQSDDLGNPAYSAKIRSLIKYAKAKGLTFTTPDTLIDHFKLLQNVQYSGSVKGDTATINVTNTNDKPIQQVAFSVRLPVLTTGSYTASTGKVVKTVSDGNNSVVYISTDIPARGTQEITIQPNAPRKTMSVVHAKTPIEGPVTITIKGEDGLPLKGAEAIIDQKYYYPDDNGEVTVDMKRGPHTVEVHAPGYQPYAATLDVKGRLYILGQFFE